MVTISSNPVWIIDTASVSDSGDYTCIGTNNRGNDRDTVTVTVNGEIDTHAKSVHSVCVHIHAHARARVRTHTHTHTHTQPCKSHFSLAEVTDPPTQPTTAPPQSTSAEVSFKH